MKLQLIPTEQDYVSDTKSKDGTHEYIHITCDTEGMCRGLKEALVRYIEKGEYENFDKTLEEYVKWNVLAKNGIKTYPIKRETKGVV